LPVECSTRCSGSYVVASAAARATAASSCRGIHGDDFVAAVRWLIERHDIEGVVNIASPHPLPNAEFMADDAGSRRREIPRGWQQRSATS